jgi:hypothetical protein
MGYSLLQSKDRKPDLERARIISIDWAKGRISVFLRNGLVSTCSYLYDISDLRAGMSVLVGRVNNSYVIMNKVSSITRDGASFSMPRSGVSISIPRPPPVFVLTATPSGSGGISDVWSDTFDGTVLDTSKWIAGHGSATINGGSCSINPASYVLYGTPCYIGWIISKAPNWDYFSATIDGVGNSGRGGIGIGWWSEGKTWGLIYTMYGGINRWIFFTPEGFVEAPYICDPNYWDFSIKVVKTPTAASGYYKTDGDWILISTVGSPSTSAVHIGVGDLVDTTLSINDFKVDFSGEGLPSVDLVWTGTAANFVLKRDSVQIYSGTGKAYTDLDVESTTTYLYEVFAYNSIGTQIGHDSDSATTE